MVDIGRNGVFQSVLLKIREECGRRKQGGDIREKELVHGFAWAGYHADMFDDAKRNWERSGTASVRAPGSRGRMQRSENGKQIKVYGYVVFRKADHELSEHG